MKNEVSLLLWSGFFLSYGLLFFLYILIFGLILTRKIKSGHFPELNHSPSGVNDASGQSWNFEPVTFSFAWPLNPLRIWYFHWEENKRSFLFSENSNSRGAELDLTSLPRGAYRVRPGVQLSDPLGFFNFRIFSSTWDHCTVTPIADEILQPLSRPPSQSDLTLIKKETRENLYESRPYFPGDDPRRINWKQYAHTGEFMIKVGEEGIPRFMRVYVILNLGSKKLPRIKPDEIDLFLRRFTGLMESWKNQEVDFHFALPGEKDFQPATLEELKVRLAGVQEGFPLLSGQFPTDGGFLIASLAEGGAEVQAQRKMMPPSTTPLLILFRYPESVNPNSPWKRILIQNCQTKRYRSRRSISLYNQAVEKTLEGEPHAILL